MAAKVTMRPAIEADAHLIMERGLRPADLLECSRMSPRPVLDALHFSLVASTHSYVVERNGEIMALAGCYPTKILQGWGSPWLVTTEDAPQYWRPFLRFSRKILDQFKTSYRVLTNVVDVENTASQRWLTWLGFEVLDTPVFVRGYPFYRFGMEVD
jgi:hypothetical protein